MNLPALKTAFATVVCFAMAGAAAAQEAPVTPAVPPVTTFSSVAYAGVDIRERSYYGYAGLIRALNGNIATNGFLVRGSVLYGEYDYTLPVVGGVIDGDVTAFSALVGYQHFFQGLVGRVYAGVDYEDHDLTPDNPFDPNRGSDFGVMVRGELETQYSFNALFYGSLVGIYGSAKERHWVRGRAGYNFGGIILGPEAIFTGNPVSDDTRFGAFAILRNPNLAPAEVSFYAGHSHTESIRGGSSMYGGVELSLAF